MICFFHYYTSLLKKFQNSFFLDLKPIFLPVSNNLPDAFCKKYIMVTFHIAEQRNRLFLLIFRQLRF